ncbi:MAG: GNAT family N-acetyltransferase [Maribacter sp.]|nr:GNAT family N-acetyltransferase [Maribacter sp.]
MKAIETERLLIEEGGLEDSSFIYKLLNSPTWIECIGDRGIQTIEDAENYIQKSLLDSYVKNGFGLYKVSLKVTKEPIGLCGFLQRDYLKSVDIGYAILPAYERNGYAFEAAKALMDYGMSTLKFKAILAITSQNNTRSQNLLKKIGLLKKGVIKPPGLETEVLLYSNQNSFN